MRWLPDSAVERLREDADLPDLGDSKYAVIGKLGSGGMGTVYLAQDAELGRKVAVKVMNIADPSGALASRMMREAQIIALLEHPGIVPIHDVGILDDGRVFYAMKLVHGRCLDESVDSASLADLLRIFQKVCEAVAFAHSHGVIHRDLKPENIMVGSFGEVLVMDWGVAKVLTGGRAEKDPALPGMSDVSPEDIELGDTLQLFGSVQGETGGGTIIGTPAYMPPEQAKGRTELLDERSDVYALGAILYFLLTGRPPSDAVDGSTTRATVPAAHPNRPRQIRSKIPKSIEAVCLKAMSEKQADRYSGAEEMARDVLNFLDGSPVSAYRENFVETAGRWLAKNRFLVLLILAYLLMRVLVLFFLRR
ncbi:MAG TPA: serine/threonine-protein kinase [Blastocatellia bacterium]|nr:serine/threonine-protein kinase [Blastocatellia bacterium]